MERQVKNSTISGCALIALGAWAGLAPFLLAEWGWEWHFGRFLLALLPGFAAIAGGLVLLSGRRRLVSIGGGLALAGGLWFIVGPPIYAYLVGPEFGTTSSGDSVRLLEWVFFFFGAGVLVSFISSYAAGFLRASEFAEDMWAEPAAAPRARVPVPERRRRQRGVSEPYPQPHARAADRSARNAG
jgi:hypothetical protein